MQQILVSLIVSASAMQATSVAAQSTSLRLQGCLVALEAQAKFPLGAIKNNCSFPINFMYCLTDINSDAIISTKRCEGVLQTQGIAPGDTIGSETDRGKAYFYACKSPDVPQDPKFVPGAGINAYCSATPSYVQQAPPKNTVQGRTGDAQVGASNPDPEQDRGQLGQAKSYAGLLGQASPGNSKWATLETSNGCKIFYLKEFLQEIAQQMHRIDSWTGACVGGYATGSGSLYIAGYNSVQKQWERWRSDGTMTWGSWNGHVKQFAHHAKSNAWHGAGAADFRMNCEVPGTPVDSRGSARGLLNPNCTPVRAP